MKTLFCYKDVFREFLKKLSCRYKIFAPVEGIFGTSFEQLDEDNIDRIRLFDARLSQSLKWFFYPPFECVTEEAKAEDFIVIGAKACDIKALKILDNVFIGGDYVDDFYKSKREKGIIIACDCTEPLEYCFCILLGDKPYVEEGADLSISEVPRGYIIDVLTEKGENLIRGLNSREAERTEIEQREDNRKKVIEKLKEINKKFKSLDNVRDIIKDLYDSEVWREYSERCVECGACTMVCPSCHCFLLQESVVREFGKNRVWDSCQYTGFAREAGGANPRKEVFERLRNRYYCKFQYKPENFDLVACTGCGRCVAACQGGIDMREVLSKML